ncbi:MAG: hypothetical protein JOZ96_04995 [Acidobacteria bacterium]|nr:hypothetical protein [Acidobacteriota bacterium]
MRGLLSLALTLAAALAAFAQTPPGDFKEVEVVGWDYSDFDEKIREAVSKANERGAGEAERRAAAEALSARADFFWKAGAPSLYKYALGDYRQVLRLRPDDAEARERLDTIVNIYEQLSRPVPANGEAKPGERAPVELFKTTPKPLSFEPGKPYAENGEVFERVAFVYKFEALAGQRLSVEVKPQYKAVAFFDLLAQEAGGTRALLKRATKDDYLLPAAGSYLIRVYAKGEGRAGYSLSAELR